MVKGITPAKGDELRRLYAKLPEAYMRAAEALSTNGEPLEGASFRRFLELDAEAGEIVRQIKEIQGTTGNHWMA